MSIETVFEEVDIAGVQPGAVTAADSDANLESVPEPNRKERSSIRFPYYDLEDSVTVARTLHDKRGGRAQATELAAELGHTAGSGTLRLRLSAASLYGVIVQEKGTVSITGLGGAVIDPQREAAARVEAFLNIPLYEKVYEEFKTGMMPEDHGLEQTMRGLGVTANQVARARQVFSRAAEQAGFFASDRRRLVRPHVPGVLDINPPPTEDDPQPAQDSGVGVRQPDGGPMSDPMIVGIFQRMVPPEGQPFSAYERRRFLRALVSVLDVIYGEPEDGDLDPGQLSKLYQLHAGEGRSSERGRPTDVAPASR